MKKTLNLLFIFFSFGLFAQDNNNPIVLTIDNESYTIKEFNYIYTKNNKKVSYKKEDLDAYMELFIDYKLKVREAKNLGYDTLPRLKNELKQYRNQLSQPYMIDKSKNEALIKEAYDRTINEIRASHILIRLNPDASPEDTLRAYNEILNLRKRILAGEDFAEVAKGKGGSQDPSAAFNGGNLGYFSAFQMIYEFEEGAFKTNVGEISMPVRTSFGYHIIKVVDKRKAKGIMQASHIMILTNDKMTDDELEKSKKKIDEIYALILKGEKFEELALKYSDDQSSKNKDGILPEFGAGTKQRMVFEFEEVAFSLTKNGEISKPFKSPYGWHIVKRISLNPVPPYEEIYRELKNKVEKDQRAQTTRQSFINQLKKDYNFTENRELLNELYDKIDIAEITQGRFNPEGIDFENASKTLFSFNKETFTVHNFIVYLIENQRREKLVPIQTYINLKYDSFVNIQVTNYEDSRLEEKYPEFRILIQEYQDGILIFEIMQKQIWNKAQDDTIGLEKFYQEHKEEFKYPTRYKGDLYVCKDKGTAKKVNTYLAEGKLTAKEIKEEINKDSQLNLNVKSNTFNSLTTPEFKVGKKNKIRTFKKGINKSFTYNNEIYIFNVEVVMEPALREFNDAKGLVTAAYQNYLQDIWLKENRNKSKITINKEVLYNSKNY